MPPGGCVRVLIDRLTKGQLAGTLLFNEIICYLACRVTRAVHFSWFIYVQRPVQQTKVPDRWGKRRLYQEISCCSGSVKLQPGCDGALTLLLHERFDLPCQTEVSACAADDIAEEYFTLKYTQIIESLLCFIISHRRTQNRWFTEQTGCMSAIKDRKSNSTSVAREHLQSFILSVPLMSRGCSSVMFQ